MQNYRSRFISGNDNVMTNDHVESLKCLNHPSLLLSIFNSLFHKRKDLFDLNIAIA